MISKRLFPDLSPLLNSADVVWVAMALVKETALKQLLAEIKNEHTSVKFLIGTDLPTEPKALYHIQSRLSTNFLARLFETSKTFHPKVYLLQHGLRYTAVVGSANMTLGGFQENIELGVFVEDQDDCIEIQKWFTKLFDAGFPIDKENIALYEKRYNETKEIEGIVRRSRKSGFKKPATGNPLEGIDFSNRYFKYEHHWAFRPVLWEDRSAAANRERKAAYDRFFELHHQIFPLFAQKNFRELAHHHIERFIVSHFSHQDGYTSKQLKSIWLSYGKNNELLKLYRNKYSPRDDDDSENTQSFINHARIQVIIHQNDIGIWLFFAKGNGGSELDRRHFRNKMNSSKVYREQFFKACEKLRDPYFIWLDEKVPLSSFEDEDALHTFCKRDHSSNHFVIGRDFHIEDPEVSLKEFPGTVMREFEKLFPLYDMMRDKEFG
jgi:HKD family nuclease